jgi:hypothetical protein
MSSFRILGIALTIGAVLTTGCRLGTEPEPQVLDELVYVSGDGQEGAPGALLPQPLVVQVNDRDGRPVQGVSIAWSVEIGNGTVNPTSIRTDRQGQAQTRWTLGAPGGHAVMAYVDEPGAFVMEVFFSANAVAP